jgi:hypothetical protein
MSYRFNMRLTDMDEEKITLLKKRYGFVQTSELFRYILTTVYEQVRNEQQLTVSSQQV